jgi:hypothetical protein
LDFWKQSKEWTGSDLMRSTVDLLAYRPFRKRAAPMMSRLQS